MDKLKYIRVQQQDGTYSDDIPLAVDAENVSMRNGNTLQNTIGSLDVDSADDITTQLSNLTTTTNQLNQQKVNHTDLSNYIDNALSSDVTSWLNNNVNPVGSVVTIDKSLTIEGSAADAKITGQIRNLLDQKEYDLAQLFTHSLLKNENFIEGCYRHADPRLDIMHGLNTYYLPKIRILKGLTYFFKQVYGYFSVIVYDDDTIIPLTNSSSPASINITTTAAQNGYVYVTVNHDQIDNAMIVQGYAAYNGAKFTGYGSVLNLFPIQAIHASNYSQFLPTLSSAKTNTIYKIIMTSDMTNAPGTMTDVPNFLKQSTQKVCLFFNIGDANVTATSQILIVNDTGDFLIRYKNETANQQQYWTKWQSLTNHDIVVAADGSGDFTSLTAAINFATQRFDSHVYVLPGTYDIINEYKSLYGSNFFENYTQTTTNCGIILKNRVVVEFAPNAYVTCNYTGTNVYTQNLFSPFNAGENGFTLINANVTSSKVRYSMHDERARNTDYYCNKYIGCHFTHDKANGEGYYQAIGGGLGKNGLIEIQNCIFENSDSTYPVVSWHNSPAEGARSQIFIRNTLVKGKIRFSYYGPSTTKSIMMVSGCKIYENPQKTQESSSYSIDNVDIIAWNNDIGTF